MLVEVGGTTADVDSSLCISLLYYRATTLYTYSTIIPMSHNIKQHYYANELQH